MLASLDYDRYRPAYSTELAGWVRGCMPGRRTTYAVDVGCGTGRSTRWARQFADRVTGVDPSAAMVAIAKEVNTDERVRFQQRAAEDFGSSVDQADLVLCGSSFEWFNKEAFRRQLDAVLVDGGKLLLVWSWLEPLDDVSASWNAAMRRLLGFQLGPEPDDVVAMAWTFFPRTPRWRQHHTPVWYSGEELHGLVRSSSYWRPDRRGRTEALDAEVSAALTRFADGSGRIRLVFREVALLGEPT